MSLGISPSRDPKSPRVPGIKTHSGPTPNPVNPSWFPHIPTLPASPGQPPHSAQDKTLPAQPPTPPDPQATTNPKVLSVSVLGSSTSSSISISSGISISISHQY